MLREKERIAQKRNAKWKSNHPIVNPDPQIADGFSVSLEKYPYLKDHLADALIATTAWKKNLEVVTTNPRHFTPIAEIQVKKFPDA